MVRRRACSAPWSTPEWFLLSSRGLNANVNTIGNAKACQRRWIARYYRRLHSPDFVEAFAINAYRRGYRRIAAFDDAQPRVRQRFYNRANPRPPPVHIRRRVAS